MSLHIHAMAKAKIIDDTKHQRRGRATSTPADRHGNAKWLLVKFTHAHPLAMLLPGFHPC